MVEVGGLLLGMRCTMIRALPLSMGLLLIITLGLSSLPVEVESAMEEPEPWGMGAAM